MIRLSCWIGVMGCVLGGKALAEEGAVAVPPPVKLSPIKRFVEADMDNSGGLSREEFANAAPKLERYFHLVDADGDGEASLDEVLEAWRKYKDRLRARLSEAPGEAAGHGEAARRDENRTDCISEPC